MATNIDFQKYKYYYNGWIARKDRKTGKTEMFVNGSWTDCSFPYDIDLMAHVGDEDALELQTESKEFLKEQLEIKALQHKVNGRC